MRAPLLAGLAVLSALGLSACSEKASDNLDNAGSAIGNDVSNAVDDAGNSIDNGLDRAGAAIDKGADRIGTATDRAADDAKREGREARQDVGASLEKAGADLRNDNH